MTSAFNRDLLEILDIKAIVTVSDKMEPLFPETIEYLVIPIQDLPSTDILSHFPKAYEFISTHI